MRSFSVSFRPKFHRFFPDELDKVVGNSRAPGLTDRVHTPYTEAVLLEVQRRGNVVPIFPAHQSINKSTKLCNYIIPPKTQIMFVLGEILKDPRVFEDPSKYDK